MGIINNFCWRRTTCLVNCNTLYLDSGTYNFVKMQRYNLRPTERVYNKGPYYTIRQWRCSWKRRWKIDFASFHFFGGLFQGALLLKKREFGTEPGLGWSWREGTFPIFFAHFFLFSFSFYLFIFFPLSCFSLFSLLTLNSFARFSR